jgi:hypothetical protein
MAWEIEGTDEFRDWYLNRTEGELEHIDAAVDQLEQSGPATGRPLVDTIKGSRFANMKELRPLGGDIRILFVFDPRRSAILLLGGDKTNQWDTWYDKAIPRADALYTEYLNEIRMEGLIQ